MIGRFKRQVEELKVGLMLEDGTKIGSFVQEGTAFFSLATTE